jgi:putative N6-adenine-specific DNA methylase
LKFIAKTLFGLEDVLATELKTIGATDINVLNRAVSFNGGLEIMYRSNMYLRTAIKVLMPIYSFDAANETELYEKVKANDWLQYLSPDQTFAIDATVFSDTFTHSKYIALKTKDGIVDQIRDKMGRRPSVEINNPDVKFNVHVFKNEVSISLDTSGDLLNRRGYRNVGHLAPLNEVLAAGMLKVAEWEPNIPLHDPMCGTGTILIEAALMAKNIAPGLLRSYFGFMSWSEFDRALWNELKEEAKSRVLPTTNATMYGADIDIRAVRAAEESVSFLKLDEIVKIERKSFENQIPSSFSGMMITNPPYGERMEKTDINAFYKMIGDQLKQNFAGYKAWLLSSNKEALKNVGLRPSKKHTLFNGPLECKFHRYDLYIGSKRERD